MFRKKGAGNLEMVIAFVFFIGFVLFLFLFLKPGGDMTTLSGAVITGLHNSFEEEVYTNLSTLFLKTSYEVGNPDCFVLKLPQSLFDYNVVNSDSYVALLSGEEVDSSLDTNFLSVSNDSNFFRVSISPEFDDDILGGCDLLSDFELGSVLERRVISYSSLEAMKFEYDGNYENLREKLGVPAIYDFAIIPEDMPELVMIPRLGIPDSVDVMARDYVFEVLKSDGTLINQKINFRLW